jgi:hypothetical protein
VGAARGRLELKEPLFSGGYSGRIRAAAFQSALIKDDEGDHRGALADIERLEPLARRIGLELPAVLHFYCNNLAVALITNGRAEDATRFSKMLLTSPFRNAYPEWQRTCENIALLTQPPPRSLVLIAESSTGEPKALTAPLTLVGEEHAVGFQRLSELLKEGAGALPESFSESFGDAGRLELASAVDTQRHLAESVVTHPAGPANAVGTQVRLAEALVTDPPGPAATVCAQAQLAESVVTPPAANPTDATISPSTAAVSPSIPFVKAAARLAVHRCGIAAVLPAVKAVSAPQPRQRSRHILIGFFSRRVLRRLSIACGSRALFPRNSGARLRPFRWSYLQLYPAYPRPPNP